MKKLVVSDIGGLADVPVGYVWESQLMRASFWRLFLYSLSSGDWNKIHVNPFTSFLFKSNLGGLTYCGDLVFARTTASIGDIIDFKEDTEVVARGYANAEFKRPVRVGTKFVQRFTLVSKELKARKAVCVWKVEIVRHDGKLLCNRDWVIEYVPAARSAAGILMNRSVSVGVTATSYAFFLILVIGMCSMILNYQPLNEYCYPIAP